MVIEVLVALTNLLSSHKESGNRKPGSTEHVQCLCYPKIFYRNKMIRANKSITTFVSYIKLCLYYSVLVVAAGVSALCLG